ncbi:MAG: PIN domain-containing protein [Candidatus Micrarchaeota archaeon]|nr:PIN domain-containing protein [Candidatus Micrarchaeota archaeon]
MILDTSFLISFFRQHDDNHKKAVEISDKNHNEEKLLPEFIYFETLTVINYKDGIDAAKEASEYLTSNQQISIHSFSDEEKNGVLMEFFAQKKQLSFEDASVVYLARKKKAGLLAFDDRIIKIVEKARRPYGEADEKN